MSPFAIVAVVVIVAVIAYAVYVSIQAGRARTRELETLAPQLGMAFVGEFAPTSAAASTGDPGNDFAALRAAFGDFRCFQGSTRPRLWNWMRGDLDGQQVSVFDYDEGHSARDTARIHTMASIDSPSLRLPSFALVPIPGGAVRPVTRLAEAIGGLVSPRHRDREIPIPAEPGFGQQYLLRGADEAAVRGVFTERVLGFLRNNAGWMIEGHGTRLLLRRLSPDEVRTYWRSAGPTSDAREIGAAVSAMRQGALGKKLTAPGGVPPAEMRGFLTAALGVADLFR
jgi:hypothetical protein